MNLALCIIIIFDRHCTIVTCSETTGIIHGFKHCTGAFINEVRPTGTKKHTF
jgi:hypothetical protein